MLRLLWLAGLAGLCSAFTYKRPPKYVLRARTFVTRRMADPNVIEAAKNQITAFKQSHGNTNPSELSALEKAVTSDVETEEIGAAMYELLCTSFLDYDRDAEDENKLVPSANPGAPIPQDAPGLKDVMTNLYVYGIRMIPSGFITVDKCKDIVENRLAARVGMSGEELDDWLDIPDMGV